MKQGIASVRDVEEALARQVMYGGDLITNLLELARVSEEDLVRLLAENQGLPPGPQGELAPAPESTRRLVPGDLAWRHGLYPLRELPGKLEVAVADPLPAEVVQDLGFALGVEVVQYAAPLVRIRQALSRDYDLTLDRRTERLLARLNGEPDPHPSQAPPQAKHSTEVPPLPRPESLPPAREASPSAPPSTLDRSTTEQRAEVPAETGFEAVAPIVQPLPFQSEPPAEPTPEPGASTSELPEAPTTAPSIEASAETESSQATPAESVASEATEQVRKPATESIIPPPLALFRLAQLGRSHEAQKSTRQRHLGPYTAAMAEQDLLDAESRDAVLRAFFDFAAQYFEYSALFAVQADLAEGRDAHGPGASRSRVRAIGVPLDLPSTMAATRDAGTWQLARLTGGGIDSSLSRDLERRPGPRVLMLPVVVRKRCVLILYGDHGERDVELNAIGDVISFTPLVTVALERVIMLRKMSAQHELRVDRQAPLPTAAAPPGALPTGAIPTGGLPRQKARQPDVQERIAALANALRLPESDVLGDDLSSLEKSQLAAAPLETAPLEAAPLETAPLEAAPLTAAPLTAERPAERAPTQFETAKTLLSQPAQNPSPLPQTDNAVHADSAPVIPLINQATPEPVAFEDAFDIDAGWADFFANQEAKSAPGIRLASEQAQRRDRKETLPSALDGSPDSAPQLEVVEESDDSESLLEAAEDYQASDSRAEAYSPRPLQPAQSTADSALPSVIVDVDEDCRDLVRRLCSGELECAEQLATLGNPAITALAAAFPGPITSELRRGTGSGPARASSCGPVLKALVRIGTGAVPFLVVRSADGDPTTRSWATRLLGELPTVESARAVAKRLVDANSEVRRSALAACRMLQSDPQARAEIRDHLSELAWDPDKPADTRHGAIEALADIRDAQAVPVFIRLLSDKNRDIVKSAHWALMVLSRQDFGQEALVWNEWWQKNRARHRIEWLMDALMHENADMRRTAGDELKSLTKEYFGYYDDLPKKERARAQQRYRDWWESKGKALFHY